MLTVPEAARRAGRNPETIRRWIREGKLPARKIGTQHVIEEVDLSAMVGRVDDRAPLPAEWQQTSWGGPMPDVVAAARRSRAEHRTGSLAQLIADGRVTPALDPDTVNLPMPVASSTGISATSILLAEREVDRR